MTDPHDPRPVDLAQVDGPLGVPGPTSQDTLDWLLQGDPAIRWRTLQYLTGASPAEVAAERSLVATEGWGARLLQLQDDDGRWGGALYSPKWTSTTYTLLLLQRLGLPAGDPRAQLACRVLWNDATTWDGGGLNLAKTLREPETCITGMLVLLAASFGQVDDRARAAVRWLRGQQLEDGGWNCETVRSGSRHGSFHTKITVLEALAAYRSADDTLDEPIHAGQCGVRTHGVAGRWTAPIPVATGSGWRSAAPAAGRPCAACASSTGGTAPTVLRRLPLAAGRHLARDDRLGLPRRPRPRRPSPHPVDAETPRSARG